jgi:hypothetical protein
MVTVSGVFVAVCANDIGTLESCARHLEGYLRKILKPEPISLQ